ncbi:MAG TPA: penicillin-binding protein 2 [Gaiellaceae bacterium]|nr:penicillin-binding protein 2 [Gaiellaceae bacterium]
MASATRGRSGRFLPPDPRVEEPYRLTPQLAFRVALLGFFALALFAVLFLRLWALQVLSGDQYAAAANNNRVRTLRVDAPRGPILDRNGRALVVNVPGTRVELWPSDLPKTWPAQRDELRRLSKIVGVPVTEILRRMKKHESDPVTPVVVQTGLHEDQITYVSEHRAEFPGVRLADSYLRKYPFRSLAAQVLGYVGEISEPELKARRKLGYRLGDLVGQAGVEAKYDAYIRGRDGLERHTVDARGRPTSDVTVTVNPRRGNQLRLTLDIELQQAAERALRYGIELAHADKKWYANGGAIVALDPRDGAILAMASNPTYSPSLFVGKPNLEKLAPLLKQGAAKKANYPGINRTIAATYPPGSTLKPVTALAAMQERLLSPHESLLCTPTYESPNDNGVPKQQFANWNPNTYHWMELAQALSESCDTYFYQVGDRFFDLPSDRGHPLQQWATRMGLGVPTGVDVGSELSGLIPTPEWRRVTFKGPPYTDIDRTWKPGYSIQLAIGQGDVAVTPMQMARLYALIANGGKLVTPHVAEDVEQPTDDPRNPQVLRRLASEPPRASGVDPAAIKAVKDGLYAAAHGTNGTSYGVFGTFPVSIAGKTGTAEKIVAIPGYPAGHQEDQAWWCGYGPTEAPTIVVCAVIENGGHGGTAAAPAALKVFEKYFGKTGQIIPKASD